MARLTRRQRLLLIALGIGNLVILGALGAVLLLSSAQSGAFTSPLEPARLKACERATSAALLGAGQSALVQAGAEGLLLIRLQRILPTGDAFHRSTEAHERPRMFADAAIWTAFEAAASQSECLRFNAVRVVVVLVANRTTACDGTPCPDLHAAAVADMSDLLTWWQGGIDDAQLARRLDYQPPSP